MLYVFLLARAKPELAPAMPAELAVQAAQRYIRTYELLTGKSFVPGELPAAARIERNLRHYLLG